MANKVVNITFANKNFTFTRALLETKARKAAAKNPPTVSALHSIYLPGIKGAVSPTWAATNILDTPAIVPNRIAIEQGAKAAGAAFRGAYNPQQVLKAFSKMSDIGVKVESHSASITYAAYSKTAAEALQKALDKMTGGKARKADKAAAPARKAARKVKAADAAPVDGNKAE